MKDGKTTDCVMEGIELGKEVYTGKAVNTTMIQDDVLAVCKERDRLLRRQRELEGLVREVHDALLAKPEDTPGSWWLFSWLPRAATALPLK